MTTLPLTPYTLDELLTRRHSPLTLDGAHPHLPGAPLRAARLNVTLPQEADPLSALIGRPLYDLLCHLPQTPPTEALCVTHTDGGVDLTLQGEGWSARLSAAPGHAQGAPATCALSATLMSGEVVSHTAPLYPPEGPSQTPWSAEGRARWSRALELLARARALHGVARQPAEAVVDPTAGLHPTVEVQGAVEVGAQTRVWHFSKLLGPLKIGARCSLGQNVVVERGVTLGENVKVQNNVSIYSGVVLEDDVFCGPSMVFTNVGTPRSHYPRRGQYQETRVKRGASIGANATVVCGHSVGRYALVGAGAVVTRDVPDYALVYGNPARVRGWVCYCGEGLALGEGAAAMEGRAEAVCGECGRGYVREGGGVTAL